MDSDEGSEELEEIVWFGGFVYGWQMMMIRIDGIWMQLMTKDTEVKKVTLLYECNDEKRYKDKAAYSCYLSNSFL